MYIYICIYVSACMHVSNAYRKKDSLIESWKDRES